MIAALYVQPTKAATMREALEAHDQRVIEIAVKATVERCIAECEAVMREWLAEEQRPDEDPDEFERIVDAYAQGAEQCIYALRKLLEPSEPEPEPEPDITW